MSKVRARLVMLCAALGACAFTSGQDTCASVNALIARNAPVLAYDRTQDSTIFRVAQLLYFGDRPISYMAWPFEVRNVQVPSATLLPGEGAGGFRFEANLDQNFTLARGRVARSSFWRASHIGFTMGVRTRMALDPSSPLVPGNWRFGFQGHFPLWNSWRRARLRSQKGNGAQWAEGQDRKGLRGLVNERNWYEDQDRALTHLYAIGSVGHYSNGQSGPSDTLVEGVRRNNYLNGDFSTNILQAEVVLAHLWNHQLVNVGSGLRYDWGSDESTFAYSAPQEDRYGRWRFLAHAQYRSRPLRLWNLKWRHKEQDGKCTYGVQELVELRFRAELECIVDATQKYAPGSKDHHAGLALFAEVNPLRSHATGIVFHWYRGRDPLNIRYDRVVTLAMVGLSFSLDKYHPVGWRTAESLQP